MRKEITEYERAQDTDTKIKCGSCDQMWDNRGINDGKCVNTVVLDAVVEQRGYSSWREKNRWNGIPINERGRLNGDEVEDYCNECWDSLFTVGSALEVEESEYFVEEQTREEYYCDFCGDCMGEESDHEVTLNPRLEIGREVATRDIGESISCSFYNEIYAKRDDVFDCCSTCADEIFNRSTLSKPKDMRQSIVDATISCMSDICVKIKEMLLLQGV